jgi:aryl-alcohol dehydrogenase-like predicted oxidoreductase
MDDLIRQGKVLYWGTSEWEPERLVETYDLCERYGLHPPQAEQPQYSMLYRERVERQILPVTQPRGIGLTTYSPLGMGMLTGKYDDGIPNDSRFAREPWSKAGFLTEENAGRVRKLRPVAEQLGITRAQLALAWILRLDGISSIITGATQTAQIEDNIGAVEALTALTDGVLTQIEDALA